MAPATPAFIADILAKGVVRMGKKQLWRLSATLRAMDSCDVYDLRETLRSVGIYLEDSVFEEMECRYEGLDPTTEAVSPRSASSSATTSPALTLVSAFMLDLIASFNPRRRHVLNLLLQCLEVPKAESISREHPEGLLHEIPLALIDSKYDVLRHPSIANDVLPVEQVRSKFIHALDFPGHVSVISVEELMLYYLGISIKEPNDTYFELLCIRSFSLDRPRLNFEDELERMQGTTTVAHFNRMVGKPQTHPLYTTTYEDYGKEIKSGKPPPISRYGRSQKFSRSIPPHTGGATSMNM